MGLLRVQALVSHTKRFVDGKLLLVAVESVEGTIHCFEFCSMVLV